MDCSPPGSSVHAILQARILEWVAMLSSRGIFPTQGWNPHLVSPTLAGGFIATSASWEAQASLEDRYSAYHKHSGNQHTSGTLEPLAHSKHSINVIILRIIFRNTKFVFLFYIERILIIYSWKSIFRSLDYRRSNFIVLG